MSKAVKIGGIVILVLVLVLVLFVAAGVARRAMNRTAGAEEGPVQVATVTRGSIEETVSATGNVGAERRWHCPLDRPARLSRSW